MKPRIFIDSSDLFSAVYSTSGHSSDLLIMSAEGEVMAVISDFVIAETQRNISELKTVTPKDVADAKQWIVLKDAPVLAAAKVSRVNMLVTLDRKHFLGRPN